uniref:Uncharacterized protein n=1 Tax=Leersia perrieri TaxID=77586 RepID=A0A0D9VU92_9ORYZ
MSTPNGLSFCQKFPSLPCQSTQTLQAVTIVKAPLACSHHIDAPPQAVKTSPPSYRARVAEEEKENSSNPPSTLWQQQASVGVVPAMPATVN